MTSNKIININPEFIKKDDIYNRIYLSNFIIYLIIIIQLFIIFLIFYYFFYQELYVLYNYFFKIKTKLDYDFIDRLTILKMYIPNCISGNLNACKNEDDCIQLKYFNDTDIKFKSQEDCENFLNILKNA